jgi:hypothetical protein
MGVRGGSEGGQRGVRGGQTVVDGVGRHQPGQEPRLIGLHLVERHIIKPRPRAVHR